MRKLVDFFLSNRWLVVALLVVLYMNALRRQGKDVHEATYQGAADRLRPVLITTLVASPGIIPMALSTSRGAELEQPLATVVIGGLITATILTLYVLPLMYPWFSTNIAMDQLKEVAS